MVKIATTTTRNQTRNHLVVAVALMFAASSGKVTLARKRGGGLLATPGGLAARSLSHTCFVSSGGGAARRHRDCVKQGQLLRQPRQSSFLRDTFEDDDASYLLDDPVSSIDPVSSVDPVAVHSIGSDSADLATSILREAEAALLHHDDFASDDSADDAVLASPLTPQDQDESPVKQIVSLSDTDLVLGSTLKQDVFSEPTRTSDDLIVDVSAVTGIPTPLPADLLGEDFATALSTLPATPVKPIPLQEDHPESAVASYSSILKFVATTILIMLSEPLLSLVDTAVVGRYAKGGVTSLAALAPATMVMENGIYLLFFWSIATTNRLAAATAKGDAEAQLEASSEGLGVGLALGGVLAATLLCAGRPLLHWALGSGTTGEAANAVVREALSYTSIRAAATPLAVAGLVAQSICLATLDTLTPARAVAAATVINCFGDWFLVAKLGMGVQGAAIATVAASISSTLILLREVRSKMQGWTASMAEKKVKKSSKTVKPQRSTPKSQRSPQLFALPKSLEFFKKELIPLAGPMFLVVLGKIFIFVALSVRAADFGLVAMATHNVVTRIFFFAQTLGDSFAQASQSFLPTVLYGPKENNEAKQGVQVEGNASKGPRPKNTVAVLLMLKRLATLAGFFAVSSSVLAGLILQKGSHVLTSDLSIIRHLQNPVMTICCCAAITLHPFLMLLEGSILAFGDVPYLVKSYGMVFTGVAVGLKFFCRSLEDVWKVVLLMNMGRFSRYALRLGSTLGRLEKEEERKSNLAAATS